MRGVKLDENLPASLVGILTPLGHDVDTVPGEGLAGRNDQAIWAAAQAARRFLITQDLDFSDIRRYTPGTHHGLLLLRLRAPGRRAITARLRQIFEREPVETWHRCFVVASDLKLRIHASSGSGRG